MNKDMITNQLKAAKTSNVTLIHKSKHIIKGKDITKYYSPISSTECTFCQWLYSDGQKLSELRNNSIAYMDNIEELHEKSHKLYFRLFQLSKVAGDTSFFGKISNLINNKNNDDCESCFLELKNISTTLSDKLTRLDKRISVLSDNEVSVLYR